METVVEEEEAMKKREEEKPEEKEEEEMKKREEEKEAKEEEAEMEKREEEKEAKEEEREVMVENWELLLLDFTWYSRARCAACEVPTSSPSTPMRTVWCWFAAPAVRTYTSSRTTWAGSKARKCEKNILLWNSSVPVYKTRMHAVLPMDAVGVVWAWSSVTSKHIYIP